MVGLRSSVAIERPKTKQLRIETARGRQGEPSARHVSQQTKDSRRARNKQARKTRRRNRR